MNNTKPLKTIIVEPDQPAKNSVIWLHGLGADGHDFVDLIPALQLPAQHAVRFIFPHAPLQPVTLNAGMTLRAWFDLYSLENLDKEDTAGLLAGQQLVNALIKKEMQQGIAPQDIILAGFSQGGAMALHTGLHFPQTLGGILGLSTYLPQRDTLKNTAHPSNASTPIMMTHGAHDPILPILLGEKSFHCLQQQGYPITWHDYPMGHELCPQEIRDIAEWIKRTLPGQLT